MSAHLPVLARPEAKPDLRPLFATLYERWRESKLSDPSYKGRKAPAYKELADEITADTGKRVDRQTLYRAIRFRVDEEEEHKECRQPQWWLILWLCHRLGWSVLLSPDGIRLVRTPSG